MTGSEFVLECSGSFQGEGEAELSIPTIPIFPAQNVPLPHGAPEESSSLQENPAELKEKGTFQGTHLPYHSFKYFGEGLGHSQALVFHGDPKGCFQALDGHWIRRVRSLINKHSSLSLIPQKARKKPQHFPHARWDFWAVSSDFAKIRSWAKLSSGYPGWSQPQLPPRGIPGVGSESGWGCSSIPTAGNVGMGQNSRERPRHSPRSGSHLLPPQAREAAPRERRALLPHFTSQNIPLPSPHSHAPFTRTNPQTKD